MFTIKGFTTKKDLGEQLKSAGAKIKMPFSVNTEFVYTKDVGKLDIYDCDGNLLKKRIDTKVNIEKLTTVAKPIIKKQISI